MKIERKKIVFTIIKLCIKGKEPCYQTENIATLRFRRWKKKGIQLVSILSPFFMFTQIGLQQALYTIFYF